MELPILLVVMRNRSRRHQVYKVPDFAEGRVLCPMAEPGSAEMIGWSDVASIADRRVVSE